MKTNPIMIEQLEGRQLLSVAPVEFGNHPRPTHRTVGHVAPLVFQGTAVNGSGVVTANLQMTVQPTANGFSDQLIAKDNHGHVTELTLGMNAAGQFSFNGSNSENLVLSGQMNSSDTAITGTWARIGKYGTSQGTLSLNVVQPSHAAGSVRKPAPPAAPTVTNYTGTATDSKDETSDITVTITDKNNVRTAVLNTDDRDGNIVSFTITPALTFSFSFSDPNEIDHVKGKLSANGDIITGGWTSDHSDGTVGHGTFIATRT